MKIIPTVLFVVALVLIAESREANSRGGGGAARLVNDLWANVDQFPYQVSIRAESTAGGSLRICSGAVLSPTFVITSARCALRNQVFHLRFNSVTHYTGGDIKTSYDARIHPQYNPENSTNDVALIRINPPLHPQAARPIKLPNQNVPAQSLGDLNGRVAILTAWGRDLSGDFSPVLQYTWTQINNASTPVCRELFQNQHGSGQRIDDSVLCATEINAVRQRHRFCAGDNGSPLVVQTNDAFILVGLGVFNAHDDHCPNATTLFTNIASVRDWIRREASV